MCVLASSCPHLSFFPLFLPHSLLPLNPPLLPLVLSLSLSLSLSPEPRLRAPLTGWGMDSFHLMRFGLKQSHSPWARGSPLQSCVFIQANQHGRTGSPSSPHRRPPSLSLTRSLFIYFTHSSSSYSKTDSPFPLPPSLSSTPSFSSLLFTSAWGFLFHSGHKALSYRLESAFLSLHLSPHLILHDITVPILPARFNSLFLFLFLYLSLSLIIWELGSVGIPAGTEGWCGPSVSWWERGGHMYRQTTPTTNSPQLTDYLN